MHPKDQDKLHDLVIEAYAVGDGLPRILRGICIELAERIAGMTSSINT